MASIAPTIITMIIMAIPIPMRSEDVNDAGVDVGATVAAVSMSLMLFLRVMASIRWCLGMLL